MRFLTNKIQTLKQKWVNNLGYTILYPSNGVANGWLGGAGTGGTTSFVLPTLDPHNTRTGAKGGEGVVTMH